MTKQLLFKETSAQTSGEEGAGGGPWYDGGEDAFGRHPYGCVVHVGKSTSDAGVGGQQCPLASAEGRVRRWDTAGAGGGDYRVDAARGWVGMGAFSEEVNARC